MGNRGRYGKYGEIKRLERLRKAWGAPSDLKSEISKSQSPIAPVDRRTFQQNRIALRSSRPSDLDFIGSLSKKVFKRFGPYQETLTDWFRIPSTTTVLAFMNKKPVGFAMLGLPHETGFLPRVGELLAIAVSPAMQRLGIGGLLMRELEKQGVEQGVEMLTLHTAADNLPAQCLFKKFGFSPMEVKRAFYPRGQDALLMSKTICEGDGLKERD